MKKLLLLSFFFASHAQIITAQITGRPINVILPKVQDSAIAFRMYGFFFNSTGFYLNIDPKLGSLHLDLQQDFDIGGCINGRNFVATHDGIYHFDARLNFFYPIEERTHFFRWYLRLTNGSRVMEETVLNSPETALEPEHAPSPQHSIGINTNVMLKKGETVFLSFAADANPGSFVTATYISFSGFKVADLPKQIKTDIR